MKHIDRNDPMIWEGRTSGGGCIILFGMPFFGVGVLLLAALAGLVPMEPPPVGLQRLLLAGMALPFLGVGLFLMTARSRVVLDRREGTAESRSGALWFTKREARRLGEFSTVILDLEKDSDGDPTYPLRLEGPNDVSFDLEGGTDSTGQRRIGEELAAFLELPFTDRSSGAEVVRQPEHLNESLRDTARREGGGDTPVHRPPGMLSQVSEASDRVEIRIPPPGLGLEGWVQVVGGLLFAGVAIVFFARPVLSLPIPEDFRWVILLFFGLFIVGPLLGVARTVWRHTRCGVLVTADATTLAVQGRGRRQELPADAIEELLVVGRDGMPLLQTLPDGSAQLNTDELPPDDLAHRIRRGPDGKPAVGPKLAAFLRWIERMMPGPEVVARTDRGELRFGKNLPPQEVRYLHAVVKAVLTR
jgi:hypothetical protein